MFGLALGWVTAQKQPLWWEEPCGEPLASSAPLTQRRRTEQRRRVLQPWLTCLRMSQGNGYENACRPVSVSRNVNANTRTHGMPRRGLAQFREFCDRDTIATRHARCLRWPRSTERAFSATERWWPSRSRWLPSGDSDVRIMLIWCVGNPKDERFALSRTPGEKFRITFARVAGGTCPSGSDSSPPPDRSELQRRSPGRFCLCRGWV